MNVTLNVQKITKYKCDFSDLPFTESEERTQKRTETHACDCISREAAIDTVVDAMMNGADADMVEGLIYMLPSAQPDLSEYSDKLWRSAYERGKRDAQPEIIRCKDCKHNPKDTWFGCPMAHCSETQRPETAWCWKGERREE
jgi:hypothetical protein